MELSTKMSSLQLKVHELENEVVDKENLLQENIIAVETIDLRYKRATKVASHIEKQMKVNMN
jgi:hypothetical protein